MDVAATFMCKNKKTIAAVFHNGTKNTVSLTLSDGRALDLPQAISASGARYATADEKVVFWNKGNTAFMTEGGVTTFADCSTDGYTDVVKPGTTNTHPSASSVTYTNTKYGFALSYPKGLDTREAFRTFYHLNNEWRAGAGVQLSGTPVISVPVYYVDQTNSTLKKSYPLYYDTEVRVGVSVDLKSCYVDNSGSTRAPTDVSINGVTFKKFIIQDAAMMQYVEGVSYRTIHNNLCYVVEQLKTGSSYMDPTMSTGTPDSVLQSYYNTAGTIAKSFKFLK
jgi:membrane-bound inhibitor of C-type lysozyme